MDAETVFRIAELAMQGAETYCYVHGVENQLHPDLYANAWKLIFNRMIEAIPPAIESLDPPIAHGSTTTFAFDFGALE